MVLGGVPIDSPLGLLGHSDADAVLHALTDAVLGAIGADDIGELFPDTDPQWKGADSKRFLRAAVAMAADRGWQVANADVTVLAEQPKLKAYKPAMRKSIAELLGVPTDAVAVKAKTNEQMGAIGRSEGLAAMAVVCLQNNE
jgi:2-C-methyl-D-erythritol 2,4-cyclodiphosphate synthase